MSTFRHLAHRAPFTTPAQPYYVTLRLEPSPDQERIFLEFARLARLAYNLCLEQRLLARRWGIVIPLEHLHRARRDQAEAARAGLAYSRLRWGRGGLNVRNAAWVARRGFTPVTARLASAEGVRVTAMDWFKAQTAELRGLRRSLGWAGQASLVAQACAWLNADLHQARGSNPSRLVSGLSAIVPRGLRGPRRVAFRGSRLAVAFSLPHGNGVSLAGLDSLRFTGLGEVRVHLEDLPRWAECAVLDGLIQARDRQREQDAKRRASRVHAPAGAGQVIPEPASTSASRSASRSASTPTFNPRAALHPLLTEARDRGSTWVPSVLVVRHADGRWVWRIAFERAVRPMKPARLEDGTPALVGVDLGQRRIVAWASTTGQGGLIAAPKPTALNTLLRRGLRSRLESFVADFLERHKLPDEEEHRPEQLRLEQLRSAALEQPLAARLARALAYLSRKDRLRRRAVIEGAVHTVLTRGEVIAVEQLDLSGIMGRENTRVGAMLAGWWFWFAQLEREARWFGRRVIRVRAAFTSQICPRCNFVSRQNRVSVDAFQCRACGFSGQADAVAAVNILARGQQKLGRLERQRIERIKAKGTA